MLAARKKRRIVLRFLYSIRLVLATCMAAFPLLSLGSSLAGIPSTWSMPGPNSGSRFWEMGDLKAAIQNVGGELGRRFLAKLQGSQPIVAMALGSSFFYDSAGCFDNGLDSFTKIGIFPPQWSSYPQKREDWHAVNRLKKNKCSEGFMASFMETLNKTWPHNDHFFVNMGKPGSGLNDVVDAPCLLATTPDDKLDLVLLDTLTIEADPMAVEKLVRKFLRAKRSPLVILVSNSAQCRGFQSAGTPFHFICHSLCLHLQFADACAAGGDDPYAPEFIKFARNQREVYQRIALHYSIPHIDLFELMLSWINDSSILSRSKSTNKWDLVSKVYHDFNHFQKCRTNASLHESAPYRHYWEHYKHWLTTKEASPELKASLSWLNLSSVESMQDSRRFACESAVLGPLILYDILLAWVYEMQSKMLNQTDTAKLPASIYQGTDTVFQSHCYGFSFNQLLSDAGLSSEELTLVLGRASSNFDRPALQPLNITRLNGWSMQAMYQGSGGGKKFKPGFLAKDKIGAALEFVVDSAFSLDQSDSKNNPELVLTYTEGWDGWGTAKVACIEGCSCNNFTIDAQAQSHKHSILKTSQTPVSQSRVCRVKITLLSGQFKLSSVMLRWVAA